MWTWERGREGDNVQLSICSESKSDRFKTHSRGFSQFLQTPMTHTHTYIYIHTHTHTHTRRLRELIMGLINEERTRTRWMWSKMRVHLMNRTYPWESLANSFGEHFIDVETRFCAPRDHNTRVDVVNLWCSECNLLILVLRCVYLCEKEEWGKVRTLIHSFIHHSRSGEGWVVKGIYFVLFF
jgi:hypothetical protein